VSWEEEGSKKVSGAVAGNSDGEKGRENGGQGRNVFRRYVWLGKEMQVDLVKKTLMKKVVSTASGSWGRRGSELKRGAENVLEIRENGLVLEKS